jgi:phage replication-related protein YjqB (UPF0714/DUF867 family)
MPDTFHSFADLASRMIAGIDYAVTKVLRPGSPVLVIAPHGGGIEAGTAELAELIAGARHNLFTFAGLRARGNRDLHLSSSRFDHPECLEMLSRCALGLAVHGCKGDRLIYVGGLETVLVDLLVRQLTAAGLPASSDVPRHLAGRDPRNVCNRGRLGRGAQLEITMDLRSAVARAEIAAAVDAAIAEYLASTFLPEAEPVQE